MDEDTNPEEPPHEPGKALKKHKKHKKHKRHAEEGDSPKGSPTSDDTSSTGSSRHETEDLETIKKKKKKQKKETHEEDVRESSRDLVKDEEVEESGKKKHKKKKKKKDREDADSETPGKRKSVDGSDGSVDEIDDAGERKKKKHKRSHDQQGEDEVSDSTRNKSNSKPAVNPELADPSKFGQWGSATFEDSKRQEKFLRLMGGFKKAGSKADDSSACSGAAPPCGRKGLFGSSSTSGKKKGLFGSLRPSAPRDNYAMDDNRAKDMTQKLENQFEQARDFRFNKKKGIGLGFEEPPEENKDFHIDKDSSQSVKFDD